MLGYSSGARFVQNCHSHFISGSIGEKFRNEQNTRGHRLYSKLDRVYLKGGCDRSGPYCSNGSHWRGIQKVSKVSIVIGDKLSLVPFVAFRRGPRVRPYGTPRTVTVATPLRHGTSCHATPWLRGCLTTKVAWNFKRIERRVGGHRAFVYELNHSTMRAVRRVSNKVTFSHEK